MYLQHTVIMLSYVIPIYSCEGMGGGVVNSINSKVRKVKLFVLYQQEQWKKINIYISKTMSKTTYIIGL